VAAISGRQEPQLVPARSRAPTSCASLSPYVLIAACRVYFDASEIADAYAYRGELDQAFTWLERAYRQKDTVLYLIKSDPFFKKLDGDPRYKAFLRKMKLPG
jgi:hypothetical protein